MQPTPDRSALATTRGERHRGARRALWSSYTLFGLFLASGSGWGQNSKLSVVSAMQPGTNFHAGVSTPDKRFDVCVILVATRGPTPPFKFQGVPVVVDPLTAIPLIPLPQYDASPTRDRSTERKWRFGAWLPTSSLVGAGLRVQALLLSTKNPGLFSISNGAVRKIAARGRTERRHGVTAWSSGGQAHISVMEIDTATGREVGSPFTASMGTSVTSGGLAGPPHVAPNRGTVVFSVNYSDRGGRRWASYAYHPATRRGFWIVPRSGYLRWGLARFRTGQSDRVWVLESIPGYRHSTGNGTWQDWNHDLVSYNVNTGRQLTRSTINNDPKRHLSTNTSFDWDWGFSGNGKYVCFKSRRSHVNHGRLNLAIFAITSGNRAVLHRKLPITIVDGKAKLTGYNRLTPLGGSHILTSYWDLTKGSEEIFAADLATGTRSAFLSGPGPVRIRTRTASGRFVVLQRDGSPGNLLYVDALRPFPGAGKGLTIRTTATGHRRAWRLGNEVFAVPGGDTVVSYAPTFLEKISIDANMKTRLTWTSSNTGWSWWSQGRWWYHLALREMTSRHPRRGRYVSLDSQNAILLVSGAQRGFYAAMLDVETMTQVSFAPPSTQPNAPLSWDPMFLF